MAITVNAILPNPMIPPSNGTPGVHILSGIVECTFWGDDNVGDVTRDTLTFNVGPVNVPTSGAPVVASCVVSLASFAFNGAVNDALWAVDSAAVGPNSVNLDAGSGTGYLVVTANLAVRGLNGVILRVNYVVFNPT